MILGTSLSVLALALVAAAVPAAIAQSAPAAVPEGAQPATTPASALPDAPETPPANRIIGIETNRDMIAAEAPTEIVINGSPAARCGLVVDFGDGTRSGNVVSEPSPFPLRLTHAFPKTGDVVVRVTGAAEGSAPPCAGALEAAVHVSPAGSKIEYITLSTGCPEGWRLLGAVNPDKSFLCAPIQGASAPTNLIHCIDGMKYFAKDGHVGCRHPQVVVAESFPKAKSPKGKRHGPVAKGKMPMARRDAQHLGGGTAPKAKTPPVTTAHGKATAKAPVRPKHHPPITSPEAPN